MIAAARRRGRAARGCSARAWSIPPGATGGPDTDLQRQGGAPRVAAIDARRARGSSCTSAPPDEAAHERDAAAKVAALERDRRAAASRRSRARSRDAGGSLAVCPDHGCDPLTGAHDDHPGPVPALAPDASGPAGRLTERAVRARCAVVDAPAPRGGGAA